MEFWLDLLKNLIFMFLINFMGVAFYGCFGIFCVEGAVKWHRIIVM